MIVSQDYQLKNGGKVTKDAVYQRWLKEDAVYHEPVYINCNPDYCGSITSKAPHIWAYGAGNKV